MQISEISSTRGMSETRLHMGAGPRVLAVRLHWNFAASALPPRLQQHQTSDATSLLYTAAVISKSFVLQRWHVSNIIAGKTKAPR